MDGVEVIKCIRSWSNVPIIVISARSEDRDKIDALDAGADDYLTKPFSVEELLARLRATQRRLNVMQNQTLNMSSVFENGDLRVDYAAGSDFAVASPLRLNDQQIVAVLIEQSGEIKGERLGKTASHADIFAVAPDPHDIIHAADE